jgi:excisionase family DNA binding protein
MNRLMTVKELADFLNVCPSTIYRLLRRRKIPAFQIGGDWRFDVLKIEQWMADSSIRPDGQP